ncbi:MAG: Ig-like domain repeat protein [Acidobacteriaceae bacterium]
MGKPSRTNPERAAARPFAERWGKNARLCAGLGLAACAAIGLLGGLATPACGQTQATTLPLLLPAAVAFDAAGNLYIAETGNHVVRKVTPGGAIATVAGDGVQGFGGDNGVATAAELDSPAGVAVDAAGNLYIADSHNQRVREVAAATGAIATIAGTGVSGFSGDGGAATAARLDLPTALALDAAGDVYVADTENHRVRRIAAGTGAITTVAGNGVEGYAGDGGAATAASIDSPNGVALDAAGNLYIADTHNGRVREVSAATGVIRTIAGTGAVAGNVQAFGGDNGAATAAGLALPRGLTMDAAGNLYFADSANHRIRRITPMGVITTVAGQGNEGFAGDSGAAVTASLDSPQSVAVSPAGLLTLADSGNQRVRQLDAQTAPYIHTIAGLGTTTPGALTLSGPSVTAYGSGAVTATLATATNATGSITLLDSSGGTQTTLGSAGLSADAASFNTSTLAAATYNLSATYAGDATHSAAQSPVLAMTVSPLEITAAANPASIIYGQGIPALSGTLNGVLAQDAGKVAASFTTSATSLSPVGVYPIAATLTGSAAGNYTVSVTPAANLNIAQAPSLTGLTASSSTPGLGLPVTLTVQATSTTSGVPTGKVTLLDGSSTLAVVALTAGGATFTTSSLALGAHSLSANYSGDMNFLPSSSATAELAVGAASDFTMTATGPTTQSIPAGSAATYSFTVGLVGATIASPIALAVQGVPTGSSASINPSYIPPGGAVTGFTMTIQTPLPLGTLERKRLVEPESASYGMRAAFAILLLPVVAFARRRKRLCGWLGVACCILLAALASGCGNRINADNASIQSTTYTLTVTGTATGPTGNALVHTATVTLEVLQ